MNKSKPYKLNFKILKILNQYTSADVSGLYAALKENYSIHTLRKTLRKMEQEQYIHSIRDSSMNKVYLLTPKGSNEIECINNDFNGFDKFTYNNIILRWATYVEGKISTTNLPNKINAISVDDKGLFRALVIEKEGISLKELIESLRGVINSNISFIKVYVLLTNSHRRQPILEEFGGETIEFFEIL